VVITHAAVFAAVFAALYTAHHVGDHWLQTHTQAMTKGQPGWTGRLACARHVLTLTFTKAILLAITSTMLDLSVSTPIVVLALTADAFTHWWIDRRTTLLRLADQLAKVIPGKGDFARLGDGATAPCGTGAYALDQSWHILWLFAAALLIAAIR
jgi:hypothetical protein